MRESHQIRSNCFDSRFGETLNIHNGCRRAHCLQSGLFFTNPLVFLYCLPLNRKANNRSVTGTSHDTLYLEKNIGHPDTSFCMQTDRYPDTIHKKSQTPSFILNAYSVDLNLAHILKKDVYPHRCTSKLCLGRLTPWLSLLVVSAYCSYCVCFASLALWLIPVAPKANQSKTSIQRLE